MPESVWSAADDDVDTKKADNAEAAGVVNPGWDDVYVLMLVFLLCFFFLVCRCSVCRKLGSTANALRMCAGGSLTCARMLCGDHGLPFGAVKARLCLRCWRKQPPRAQEHRQAQVEPRQALKVCTQRLLKTSVTDTCSAHRALYVSVMDTCSALAFPHVSNKRIRMGTYSVHVSTDV